LGRRRRSEEREKAVRRWVNSNLPIIEEAGYISPEEHELVEGGFYDQRDPSAKELYISNTAPQASQFGLILVEEKEHNRLLRKCEETEELVKKLTTEKERVDAENRQLRQELSRLPRRRYRFLKPFGVFKPGQVLETYDLEWAGRMIERGVLEPANGGHELAEDVEVEQYCCGTGATVTLRIRGRLTGDLVEGTVEWCSAGECASSQFCWLGRHVLTSTRCFGTERTWLRQSNINV